MITFTITGDTVTVTDTERSYIEKRFASFDKFADDGRPHEIMVTVSKATAHERPDAVRMEVRFTLHAKDFFVTGEAHDVNAAADMARDELMREVTHSNAKHRTLFHRGARRLKSLMRRGRD